MEGRIVTNAEISLFSSVIPEVILQAVDDAVAKFFVIKNIWCHSLSLAIFSVIHDLFPNHQDFIYLDVSDEMTDISIVKNGLISSNASFPFGRNQFIRELAKNLKVTEVIADSFIRMHGQKSNDELAALKIDVAMDTVIRDWSTKANEVFNSFIDKLYVPQTIFFVAGNDLISFLADKLRSENYTVLPLEARKINLPTQTDNTIFKILV